MSEIIYLYEYWAKKKNYLEKEFFNLTNNAVFRKTMENLKNHRDLKLIATETRRNYLMSEPNLHTTNKFSGNLLAVEMKKTQILMNKPVYSSLPILEMSKIVILLLWDLSTLCVVDHLWPLVLRSLLCLLSTLLVYWYRQCVTVHHVPKSMSCRKPIVVITGRAHCFYDYIYIYIYIYIIVSSKSNNKPFAPGWSK